MRLDDISYDIETKTRSNSYTAKISRFVRVLLGINKQNRVLLGINKQNDVCPYMCVKVLCNLPSCKDLLKS